MAANAADVAGFDCAQAASKIEQQICASPRLNLLDSRMGEAFAKAKRTCPAADVLNAQRHWLRQQRNRCSEEPCLIAAYENRLQQLAQPACGLPHGGQTDACQAGKGALLGAWKLVSNGGPFEEMAFTANRFDSWLHQRPELSGARWRVTGCELHVKDARSGFDGRYTLLKMTGNRLFLRESGEREIAVYQQIRTRK
jgi:hypothetical protein